MDEKKLSILQKGFGSVSPIQRPEDFEQLRKAFDQAVAEEVMAEINAIDVIHKTDTSAKEQ